MSLSLPKIQQLLSVFIFVLAATAIYHYAQEITLDALLSQLAILTSKQIALACLFSLFGYLVMTGYDWSALRYLGHNLKLGTIVLAASCGCAVSNALGMNLVTGGSVRYRVYSSVGLSASDTAKVLFFGMAAYTISTGLVVSIALLQNADIAAHILILPRSLIVLIGSSSLTIVILFLILTFVRRTPLSFGKFQVNLPSGPLAVAQLLFAILEMIFAGGCLYILLPSTDIPFLAFLSICTLATLLGLISHVPSGLGVFEGIMLLAFRDALSLDELLAGLLVYRLIYYIAPLCISILILSSREVSAFTTAKTR